MKTVIIDSKIDPQAVNDSISTVKQIHPLMIFTRKFKGQYHPYNVMKKVINFYNSLKLPEQSNCHYKTAKRIRQDNILDDYKIRLIGTIENSYHSYIVNSKGEIHGKCLKELWPVVYKTADAIWELEVKVFKKIAKRFGIVIK